MVSNLVAADVEAVLDATVAGSTAEVLVVDPSAETLVSLVEAAADRTDLPPLSVLADEAVSKTLAGTFSVASRAADLVEDGALDLRVLDASVDNTLLISDERVVAFVTAGEAVGALSTTDEAFVDAVAEPHRDAFEAASTYDLRTPSLRRVRETLADEIGPDVRDDFDAVLEAAVPDQTDVLDEVTVALLVAARNDVLLYDVSKWGEDVGIASKATFSRTKTRLEDAGLIDTEKVPIDVGRPRLRLTLGDDRLDGLEPAAFAATAVDVLSQ
ncbi:transcriptional regulator TbsP [Halorubrum sp. SY-15]|jgi:hypothetical protein|uniref:transcriptional regulator TbsP n=1 Tax=Halorubrum sp. SY-15 TaxID=3402277 RepID=UPI003EB9F426